MCEPYRVPIILFGRMTALEAELRHLHGVSVERVVDEGPLGLLVLDGRDEQCLVEVERAADTFARNGTRAIVIRTPAGAVDPRASLARRWNACVIEPSESAIASIRAISDSLTVCGLVCFDVADLLTITKPPSYGGNQVPRARSALLTIHTPPALSLADISSICDGATNAYPDIDLLIATPSSNALALSLIVLADA